MNEHTPWQFYAIFISSTFTDMQAKLYPLKNVASPDKKAGLQMIVRKGRNDWLHQQFQQTGIILKF